MARAGINIAAVVGLLADHLDAVLAAGEDLLALEVDVEGTRKSDGAAAPWEKFEPFVAGLKLYELTIVSRVLQARRRAEDAHRDVMRADPIIGTLIGSFIGGTAVLEDSVAELADRVGSDFDCGLDPLAYMRTRGIIPADAGTLLAGTRVLSAGEGFMVARRIGLGLLLDLVAAFLDALDNAYGLFDEDIAGEAGELSDGDAPAEP
ncbi:unnamed protein product, partial [Phaeothamnion confervicola]